jgi:hypothetical protein
LIATLLYTLMVSEHNSANLLQSLGVMIENIRSAVDQIDILLETVRESENVGDITQAWSSIWSLARASTVFETALLTLPDVELILDEDWQYQLMAHGPREEETLPDVLEASRDRLLFVAGLYQQVYDVWRDDLLNNGEDLFSDAELMTALNKWTEN